MRLSTASTRIAKRIVSPLLDTLGLTERALARAAAPEGAWTVLMYHRVIEDPRLDPYGLGMCVGRARFAAQLEVLARHFRIEPVAAVVGRLRRGEAPAPRTLSLTFDDGYRDNAEQAVPMMRALGLPCSLYVCTGELDPPTALWWDRVLNAVEATGERGTLSGAELGLPCLTTALSFARGARRRAATALLDALWRQPHPEVLAAVTAIETRLAPRRAARDFAPRLNAAEIAALAGSDVEIGAHTVSHPNLTLLDTAALDAELTASRDTLQAITGTSVAGFAYPAGHADARVAARVRAAGYTYALGVEPGINLPGADLHALRRIGAPDAAAADFKRALARAMRHRPAPGRGTTARGVPA